MKTFYLPIAATSVAHYFGSACIKPAKYFSNRPSDEQDKYNEALLLTNYCPADTACCFEIVMTDEEESLLQEVTDGVYLFLGVLPITRIKSILFKDKSVMENTLADTEVSTAFIPESLPRIAKEQYEKHLNVSSVKQTTNQVATNLEEKIDRYNRILGALALMKLAKEENMSYSDRYIATVSFFNKEIEKQLNNNSDIANQDNSLSDIFQKNNISDKFSRVIDDDFISAQAEKCKESIKREFGIIKLDCINNSMLYTYAVLRTYGIKDDGRKRIDELITKHFADIREDKREAVAMYYGYNRGYNKFNNYYRCGESADVVDVKFKLDSQFDYYVIESVYQYVFNGKISGQLPYIDSWCPKQRLPSSSLKYNEYRILDKIISVKVDNKKKVGSEEWWNGWQEKFDSITLRDFGWEHIKKNILEPLFEEVKKSFKRNEDNLNYEIASLHDKIKILEQENDKFKSINQELEHNRLSTPDRVSEKSEVVADNPPTDLASAVNGNEGADVPSPNDGDTPIEQFDSAEDSAQKIINGDADDKVDNSNGTQEFDACQQKSTMPINEPTTNSHEENGSSENADVVPVPKNDNHTSRKRKKNAESTTNKNGNAENEFDFEK